MAPTAGEILFLDTNVLLTATDELRAQHREAQGLITESGARGIHLAASGQILREYLVVATRPREANGLGLDVKDAVGNVNQFLRHLHLYDENEEVSRRLRRLAAVHGLRGRRLHDANIAATVSAHGIRFVVTQNGADFALFDGIEIVALSSPE